MEKLKQIFVAYREQILYLFFGGLTTLVNWGCFGLLDQVIGVPYLWSTAISQVISIFFAYFTNRKWVFETKASGAKEVTGEILRFFGCRGVSFFLDLGFMFVGVDLFHVNSMWMKLIANVVVVIVNYFFSKLLVFRKTDKNESEGETSYGEKR